MKLLDAEKSIAPDVIEYRARTPFGIEVVRVWIVTETPRIVAYLERGSGTGNERIPMSLFRDEVDAFCDDALLARK